VNSKIPSRLVPFRQWCHEVGISVQAGYRQVKRGRLVVVKVGRRSYVRESDSEEWLRSLETLSPHGTSRRAQRHTETQDDDERHETVGSKEMEHPVRNSLPRARASHDPDVPPWELEDDVTPTLAQRAQPPPSEKRAPDRFNFDEVPDLPGCLHHPPALSASPPVAQTGPTRGVLAPETNSATTGSIPTPTVKPKTHWPTDRCEIGGPPPDMLPSWEAEPPAAKAPANRYWPTDGEITAAYPQSALYVQALRDWQRHRWWRDRAGLTVGDRAPLPEDFLPPAEALRMRGLGDPIEALRQRRGVS